MADREALNLATFWSLLGKLLMRLIRERAHGEIIISIQDGTIRLIRVNRNYLPHDLPEV